ncbi:MAG: glutathione S-transferase N-terminal domain-containing protein [Pseudomonadota bacterium]
MLLYDLAGDDNRRFSPYCWRAKMALAHKGLAFETTPVPFTGINAIGDGSHKTVPVLDHDGTIIRDSFAIAEYLEDTFPHAPSLFDGAGGRAVSKVVETTIVATLVPVIASLCVHDIHEAALPEDRDYFRQSRESRFGKTLEAFQEGREERREALTKALHPFRMVLRERDWLGGERPLFVDYMLFGTLQWPRVASAFPMLDNDDPVAQWFERVLNLHDGLGKSMPAAA